MKMTALALALALSPASALAFSPAQCDSLTTMAEAAMHYRMQGDPIHRALGRMSHAYPEEQKLWSILVMKVYDLPTAQLAGPQRADILTNLYVNCLAEGE